jgi:rare lipoprotein A (peptidoglycan hydrolase)
MSERHLARRHARWEASRGRKRSYEPARPRPDRVAAWAVFLGIFLVLVASASSRGSTGGAELPPTGGAGTEPVAGSAPSAGQPPQPVAQVSSMSVRVATWYGPGLYGRRTACGLRLTRKTPGVAHRTLPCGTPVTLYYRGRFETVRVIDRGPHARGITWDLTAATARSLGFRRTGKIRSLP